jgi:hypothetical protein
MEQQQKPEPRPELPIIRINEEGAKLLNQLMDLALKSTGLQALEVTQRVIIATKTPIPPQSSGVKKEDEAKEFSNHSKKE